MARKKKSEQTGAGEESGRVTAGHNAKVRKETIVDVCRQLHTLEAERKGISEQINELKQTRIKGELNMKIADFNAAYRLYGLENADRDQFFDALRETFEALGVGGQLDFLQTRYGRPAARGVDESAPVGSAAAAGEIAGSAGKAKSTNPYPLGTPARESWDEAFDAAQAGNRDGLGTGAEPAHV